MFIVTLRYSAELDKIDKTLPDHAAWLDKNYADGVFVLSGRQVPRTGGVILAVNTTREDLDRRLSEDPFRQRGLADYSVVECAPSRVANGLERLREL